MRSEYFTFQIFSAFGSVPLQRPMSRGFTRIELGIVVSILALGILVVAPVARRRADERAAMICRENLTKIDGAIEQWALENNKACEDLVVESDIVKPGAEGYLAGMPVCPNGHTYVIKDVSSDPICSGKEPEHELPDMDLGTICELM